MAEDRSAIVENIYDLTMVTNHADSLVSRIEGHVSGRRGTLPPSTVSELDRLGHMLNSIAGRLLCEVFEQRPVRKAAEQGS